MKKALVALTLVVVGSVAFASCPPNKPYGCYIWAGKTVCGCGY